MGKQKPKKAADLRKEQAERFAREKQALVNVLRHRIEWAETQTTQTAEPDEQQWYEELSLRDREMIENVKQEFERRAAFYKRHQIDLTPIDYGE